MQELVKKGKDKIEWTRLCQGDKCIVVCKSNSTAASHLCQDKLDMKLMHKQGNKNEQHNVIREGTDEKHSEKLAYKLSWKEWTLNCCMGPWYF